MTLRPALLPLLAACLLAMPALAQDRGRAGGAPPIPALAPPPPAQLDASAARPPAIPLPPGIEPLPDDGGWRVLFTAEGRTVEEPARLAALAEIGRRAAAQPRGRVTLLSQVSTGVRDVSLARRQALARALAVKNALVAGGLPETRIDVRPLGRIATGIDAVDIIPPDANRTPAP